MCLVAACALPGSPATVSAEPTELPQWVKTGDDSVVRGSALAAVRAAGSQYQAIINGAGFNANDLRNYGAYTLRLVTSGYGDIEGYRAELQQTANEINAQTGLLIRVGSGTVAGPADPLDLQAPLGEIWVMISSISPCGPLAGGTLGCGGPDNASEIKGEFRWSSGTVWLSPTLQTKCQQPVTSHEVGHALGLAHFDQQYLGQYQIMKSSTACSFSAFRAGDINGLRFVAEGVVRPSNDNVAVADEVCALRDTTVSAVTWFATPEVGEPAHAGLSALNSVWYRYTALQAGSTTISTTNDGTDDFDTILAVYTGTMFGGAVPIASNDDFSGALSQVTFNATIGTTYYIAVDVGGFDAGETDVFFNLPGTIPPPAGTAGVPTRFLDSRRPGGRTFDCNDQAMGRLAANTTYQMSVINRSFVTGAATSVIMNVTIVSPDAAGYLTVFPCGGSQPNASSLNFAAGDVIANLVISGVGTGGGAGKVCFFTSANTDLIVDVSNFFAAAPPFTPLTPARLLDTRVGGTTTDGIHAAVGRIAAGGTYELPVISRVGVPANPATVVLNVTAVNPGAGGYVTVYPCGAPGGLPNTSNLNFAAGDVIPNFVVAKVGVDGKVCFYSSVATDLLVDVNGYFLSATAPPSLAPLAAPIRLLDTRNPGSPTTDHLHEGVGRLAAGGTYQLPVLRGTIPGTATSVVLNVTAVNPSNGGYLTIFPCGATQPNASNLNFQAGDVIPNSVIAKVGTGGGAGKVCIFSSAAVDLLVDASGYFI